MTEAIDYSRAAFLKSAPDLGQCPADEGREVAFAGRSNAGKSSVINTFTGQGKLARTSKTPGRTQLINFFTLMPGVRFVDLPGYGYAKVPMATKREWDRNLADYLQRRRSLRGLVLLMDIRHPLQEYDWQMILWARESRLPLHMLLTKADKLRHGPAKSTLLRVAEELRKRGIGDFSLQTFSSLKRTGLEELRVFLDDCLSGVEEDT